MYKQVKLVAFLLAASFLSGCIDTRTADEYVAESKQHIEQNDTATAIIKLKNALSKYPEHAESRHLLGSVYFSQGQFAEAAKEFERAYRYSEKFDRYAIDYAKALYYQENYIDSLEILSDLGSDLSTVLLSETYYYQYLNLFAQKEEAQAFEVLQQALDSNLSQPYKTLFQVVSLLRDEKLEQSVALMAEQYEALKTYPEFLKSHARVNMLMQNYAEAVKSYSALVEQMPDYHLYRLTLADAQIKNQDFSNAEKTIDFLLSRYPKQAYANLYKSIVRFQQQDCDNGKMFSERAIQAGLSTTMSRLVAGVCSFRLEKFEQSYQHLLALKQMVTLPTEIERIFSAVQLQLGYDDGAVDSLLSLQDSSDKDAALFIEAGIQAQKSGNIESAQKMLTKASEIESLSVNELARLGMLDFSINQNTKKLEQAAQSAEAKTETKFALAIAYLSSGDVDKAQDYAKSWLQSEPDNLAALNIAAYSALQLGDVASATDYFERSLEVKPGNMLALVHLAEQAIKAGNTSEARAHLEQLIKSNSGLAQSMVYYYKGMRQLELAKPALEKLASMYKQNLKEPAFSLVYSQILFAENQYDEVISILEGHDIKAALNGAEMPETMLSLLAHSHWNLKNIERAESHFITLTRRFENNERHWFRLLMFYDQLNINKKGLEVSNRALSKFKDNVALLVYNIDFSLKEKQLSRIQRKIARLKEQDPNFLGISRFEGQLALAEGRSKDAVRHFKNYHDKKQDQQSALMYFQALKQDGQEEAAIQHLEDYSQSANDLNTLLLVANEQISIAPLDAIRTYEKLVQSQPEHVVANNNLAWLYMQQAQYAKALQFAEKSLSKAPESPQIIDTYALILFKAGQLAEANTHIEKAYTLAPNSSEIAINYLNIKQAVSSKSELQSAIETVEQSVANKSSELSDLLSKLKENT
ncbi:XrtA/PEP-CTERM system TPR-repeat protein PrsT [Catenovulum sediminis]|uniref:XrtA/PEP-CTERM system TPR-repeat protein PrsT n=1 Tax=Catenovulum sediminis TaxID=1740262 RepID=A0ABV1RFJ5_9ALTE|nr:XrtA/PEP-CTERM system TPR-repeat protein PrsT [Catenovulum sediminis]